MARYIDADKLEAEINKEKAMSFYDLLDKVTFAPTEDVRPFVRGRWIHHKASISTGFKELRECSNCKCFFRWDMPRNTFCPNCGSVNGEGYKQWLGR